MDEVEYGFVNMLWEEDVRMKSCVAGAFRKTYVLRLDASCGDNVVAQILGVIFVGCGWSREIEEDHFFCAFTG